MIRNSSPISSHFCVRGERTPLLTWLGSVVCSIRQISGLYGSCVPEACRRIMYSEHSNRVSTVSLWAADIRVNAITCMVIILPRKE